MVGFQESLGAFQIELLPISDPSILVSLDSLSRETSGTKAVTDEYDSTTQWKLHSHGSRWVA